MDLLPSSKLLPVEMYHKLLISHKLVNKHVINTKRGIYFVKNNT